MKQFTSKNQKTGQIGEDIACKYLIGKGHSIIERNYTKKWGEIDIISSFKNVLYFIEVKSIVCDDLDDVTRVTIRPEENLHEKKLERLSRTIETYLSENVLYNKDWQVDLLAVYIDQNKKRARVRVLERVL
jgi:putative endonuclease